MLLPYRWSVRMSRHDTISHDMREFKQKLLFRICLPAAQAACILPPVPQKLPKEEEKLNCGGDLLHTGIKSENCAVVGTGTGTCSSPPPVLFSFVLNLCCLGYRYTPFTLSPVLLYRYRYTPFTLSPVLLYRYRYLFIPSHCFFSPLLIFVVLGTGTGVVIGTDTGTYSLPFHPLTDIWCLYRYRYLLVPTFSFLLLNFCCLGTGTGADVGTGTDTDIGTYFSPSHRSHVSGVCNIITRMLFSNHKTNESSNVGRLSFLKSRQLAVLRLPPRHHVSRRGDK
jgi:hypothetical protein